MCFHNDPEANEPDPMIRECIEDEYKAIVASIAAGQPNNLEMIYDRLDDWWCASTRAATVKLIVDSLAGKNPFAELVRQLAWDEATPRGELAYSNFVGDMQDLADDRRIAAYEESRA